jgi:hypothetical protein
MTPESKPSSSPDEARKRVKAAQERLTELGNSYPDVPPASNRRSSPEAQAVETLRVALEEGCGCDDFGNPSRCIMLDEAAALAALQAALKERDERIAELERYLAASTQDAISLTREVERLRVIERKFLRLRDGLNRLTEFALANDESGERPHETIEAKLQDWHTRHD